MVTDVVRISTDGLSPREAREYWSDHVSDACHGIRCDFPTAEPFEASVEYADLSFGKLAQFWLPDIQATRTPFHIARDGLQFFCVSLVRKGTGRIVSGGKELDWRPGDVYCGSVSMPFDISMKGAVEFTTIYFEEKWLNTIVPIPTNLYLTELARMSNWGRALAAVLQEVTPHTVKQLALSPSAVAENIAGLLTLSSGPEVYALRTSNRSLLERMRRDLRDRLSDPTLSPTSFARDHGLSLRTLHATFFSARTTFMSDLTAMRLDKGRVLLADRRFEGKTISEIALTVGFLSTDHFSTRFRKAYGMPPSAYRALARDT